MTTTDIHTVTTTGSDLLYIFDGIDIVTAVRGGSDPVRNIDSALKQNGFVRTTGWTPEFRDADGMGMVAQATRIA